MRNELGRNIDIAIIVSVAERREEDLTEGIARVISTSDEVAEEAIKAFQENTGATIFRLDSDQARMERNRFAFSESRWKAPWQPTGPRLNWRTQDGTPIQ